jgi:hypothetical protein
MNKVKGAFATLTGIAAVIFAFESFSHSKEAMWQTLQLANVESTSIITVDNKLPYYAKCAHCASDLFYGGASGVGAIALGAASAALYNSAKKE